MVGCPFYLKIPVYWGPFWRISVATTVSMSVHSVQMLSSLGGSIGSNRKITGRGLRANALSPLK